MQPSLQAELEFNPEHPQHIGAYVAITKQVDGMTSATWDRDQIQPPTLNIVVEGRDPHKVQQDIAALFGVTSCTVLSKP